MHKMAAENGSEVTQHVKLAPASFIKTESRIELPISATFLLDSNLGAFG